MPRTPGDLPLLAPAGGRRYGPGFLATNETPNGMSHAVCQQPPYGGVLDMNVLVESSHRAPRSNEVIHVIEASCEALNVRSPRAGHSLQ